MNEYTTLTAHRRFERRVERLHDLGPRATGEMLRALAARTGVAAEMDELLADFSRLRPELVRAVGGSSFPRRLLRSVPANPVEGRE